MTRQAEISKENAISLLRAVMLLSGNESKLESEELNVKARLVDLLSVVRRHASNGVSVQFHRFALTVPVQDALDLLVGTLASCVVASETEGRWLLISTEVDATPKASFPYAHLKITLAYTTVAEACAEYGLTVLSGRAVEVLQRLIAALDGDLAVRSVGSVMT